MMETNTKVIWPSGLKIGSKSHKDPHIRIAGRDEDVKTAKNKIMSVLDTRMSIHINQRVEVTGKDVQGLVAYVGTTSFASGKWVGVILDEPKGKNNGTVQGKSYFQCKENCGVFVRPSQLTLLDEAGNKIDLASPSPGGSSATSPDDTPRSSLRSKLSSSRQSLSSVKSSRAESRSREDISINPQTATPTHHTTEQPSKRASFLEFKTPGSRTPSFKTSSSSGKPKSFIPKKADSSENDQTGFVETLKPQFTPGQVLASPGSAHHRLHSGSEQSIQQPSWEMHTGQNAMPTQISIASSTASSVAGSVKSSSAPTVDVAEVESLKSQVQDLTEKLDTIKKFKHFVNQLSISPAHLSAYGFAIVDKRFFTSYWSTVGVLFITVIQLGPNVFNDFVVKPY